MTLYNYFKFIDIINMKRSYFLSLLLCFLALNCYANPEFTLKQEDDDYFLEINLPEDTILYANKKANEFSFQSRFELLSSENLQGYEIHWPAPKVKSEENIGKIYYYDGNLRIPIEFAAKDYSKPVSFEMEAIYAICSDQCTPMHQNIKEELKLKPQSFEFSELRMAILFAILGGFILNFMPCVLPVLSLKVMSFVKNPDTDRKKACFFTIMGIMTSFFCLAIIMILLKKTSSGFGFGANFQVPEFVIALAFLITAFTSGALGRINFSLPDGTINSMNNFKINNQYLEHFFSGILATLLSTPCNAPFLCSAMAFILTANYASIILISMAIGLGFSTPYFALALHPRLLDFLPKSGNWMYLLKKLLAFLLAGTILWLLIILYDQVGTRGVSAVFFLLLLFKFQIENKEGVFGTFLIKILSIIAIILSALIMPSYMNMQDAKHQKQIDAMWHEFKPHQIQKHVQEGKVVFVAATASWCVTCKYNDFMVMNRDHTIKLLSQENIVAMKADMTNRNEEAMHYMMQNKQNGIPFYKIYGPSKPGGLVLPILIEYSHIVNAIKEIR